MAGETPPKKKRSGLGLFKDTVVPGQLGRGLLLSVNKKLKNASKKK